jgi:hypothetical protein
MKVLKVPRTTTKSKKSLENDNAVQALEKVLRSADPLLVVDQTIGDIEDFTHDNMQREMMPSMLIQMLENKCKIQQLQEEIASLRLEHKRQVQKQGITQKHTKKEDLVNFTSRKPTSMMTSKELSKKSSTISDIGEEEKKEDFHDYLNEHVVFSDTDSDMQSSYQYCVQQQEQGGMPLQQTQPRAPPQRRSLSACGVAGEAGNVSDAEEEEPKEGICDNANWNDNADEYENVVFCDMDDGMQSSYQYRLQQQGQGGLQPHVPQQSQHPSPCRSWSAGNLLRRRDRAPSRNKGASPNVGIFAARRTWRQKLSLASEQAKQLGGQHMDCMREEEVENGSNRR